MRKKKQIGGINSRESRKKTLVRRTLLPLLYKTKKGRKGFTVGGVKFKIKNINLLREILKNGSTVLKAHMACGLKKKLWVTNLKEMFSKKIINNYKIYIM